MNAITLGTPQPGMDVPVYPWKSGEVLYAASLNAAIGNAGLSQTTADARYLPTMSGTPPMPPVPGQLWWDSITGQLYLYYNGAWVAASNIPPGLPTSGGTMTGPLLVTATGGTTARSVQDRFGEVVDIHDFGPIGTGNAATDTATFLAAVAALPSNGGLLWIGGTNPQGITLNQTITITKSCKILGSTANGWCSTIVCLMSGPAIVFSDPTPSYQKTFEVENVRFVANNSSGPTQSAIQVTVGPTTSQVFPSFIGRNLTVSSNVASAASPYAQTFTRGIEFVPASAGSSGHHCFWNVVLENIFFLGVTDTATGQPIAGTQGIAFGEIICSLFRFVHVSLAASGFHQTAYCEGITCFGCQLFNVTNGWDQAGFAPDPSGNVKLLQPVFAGSHINATQSSLALDCVYIGSFEGNYLQGAGSVNIALSNAQQSVVSGNFISQGTTGVALTQATYNQTNCIVAGNVFSNIGTTHVQLGSGTFYNEVLDNSAYGVSAPVVTDAGTGNIIRGPGMPLRVGVPASTDSELQLVGASGAWRAMSIWTGGTASANQRWAVGTGTTTESGGNAGSDFQITAYSDTGANLGQPFIITRATGAIQMWNGLGLFGHAPVTARPTVTGAKGGNVALGSLLTALAAYGLITDSTTA